MWMGVGGLYFNVDSGAYDYFLAVGTVTVATSCFRRADVILAFVAAT